MDEGRRSSVVIENAVELVNTVLGEIQRAGGLPGLPQRFEPLDYDVSEMHQAQTSSLHTRTYGIGLWSDTLLVRMQCDVFEPPRRQLDRIGVSYGYDHLELVLRDREDHLIVVPDLVRTEMLYAARTRYAPHDRYASGAHHLGETHPLIEEFMHAALEELQEK